MKTVLIADDEEHLRLLISTTVSGPDHRTVEARDGVEAFDLVQREPPDLMIIDWMMPGMTGIQLLKSLREDPETTAVPVIMITAKAHSADRYQAGLLGIRGFLAKPFSPLELLELVEKVLGEGVQ
jgi:CheY-like chemotaxis protein